MADMLETTLGRRIVAAAALKGWSRDDLPTHFGSYGKGLKHMASRLARDPKAAPDDHQLGVLSEVLGVPKAWFITDDLHRMIEAAATAPGAAQIDAEGKAAVEDLHRGAGGARREQREGKAAGR